MTAVDIIHFFNNALPHALVIKHQMRNGMMIITNECGNGLF